jgi:hypothetical protein
VIFYAERTTDNTDAAIHVALLLLKITEVSVELLLGLIPVHETSVLLHRRRLANARSCVTARSDNGMAYTSFSLSPRFLQSR